MKIKLLTSLACAERGTFLPGTVYECDKAEALRHISGGNARELTAKEKKIEDVAEESDQKAK